MQYQLLVYPLHKCWRKHNISNILANSTDIEINFGVVEAEHCSQHVLWAQRIVWHVCFKPKQTHKPVKHLPFAFGDGWYRFTTVSKASVAFSCLQDLQEWWTEPVQTSQNLATASQDLAELCAWRSLRCFQCHLRKIYDWHKESSAECVNMEDPVFHWRMSCTLRLRAHPTCWPLGVQLALLVEDRVTAEQEGRRSSAKLIT